MHTTPATRVTVPLVVAISTVFTLILPAILPGCGPPSLDVDKGALYTQSRLRPNWVTVFERLHPDAKVSSRKAKADKGIAERIAGNASVEKKVAGTKKKATGPATIDDVLDDIDNKLDLIKGISRSDACRKMIDTLSQDKLLTDSEKKTLTELVGKLNDVR